MTLFIALAAFMLALALALIGWPLWRSRREEGTGGLIAVIVLALVLPLAATLMYRSLSTWSWDPKRIADAYAGHQSIEDMVAKLEERLKKQPEDVDSWLMLGRTRFVLNNYPGAVDAFSSAYQVSKGQNVDAIVGYAETLAITDSSTLGGKAGQLFEDALKLDPNNVKALFYGGSAAAASGKPALARERWAKLLSYPLPDDVRAMLAVRIGQLDQELGRPIDTAIAKLAVAPPAPPAAPAAPPAAAAAAAAGAGSAVAASGPGIVSVHVTLSPALAAKVAPGTPLFVLARDPSQPGPPFAAKRFGAVALPIDITLTESDAMMPGRTIKDAHQLTIVARFSTSGRPQASSGDIYGEVAYDLAKGATADLIIDKQVP